LLKTNLDKMVLNGNITQDESKKVFRDAKAVYTQLDKMPSNIDPSITLEVANALQNIQDLEVEKKNTDPAFHGPINERLEQARQELGDIYINQDVTKAQRAMKALGLKGETKAANTDNEFQGY
jgi:polyhydroxyalkanoate synthesis regulator phasin